MSDGVGTNYLPSKEADVHRIQRSEAPLLGRESQCLSRLKRPSHM
jgi:hypothetical protein